MNDYWFSTGPKERLALWRNFRKSLKDESLERSLEMTSNWWSFAPISANVFDAYDPNTWPKPWDLIWNGEYDENNIALGMAYTLHLGDVAECELAMVQDKKDNVARLVAIVGEQYVLNYRFNTVDKIDVLNKCDILHKKTLN
jgi:hypothetical protein